MVGAVSGGPSDDKDAKVKALEDENAKLKAARMAALSGQARSKALRLEREAAANRVFGKWGRR